ncbi:hypothetical protein Tco_0049303 [Tanacetum coccineum]
MWNVDVLPRSPMFCPLLFLAWSRVVGCPVAVHVPRGCAERLVLLGLTVVCRLCFLRSGWCLTALDPFGPWAWARSLLCDLGLRPSRYYTLSCPPSLVCFPYVRRMLLDLNPLSCLTVRGLAYVSRTPLGTRIVATVHFPLFPPFDGSSIYTVTSVLTQRELDLFCSTTYNIPAALRPLFLPWFYATTVVNDPLPMDEAVNLPCAELLNENRTLIKKYPETFLCLVGLSRSFVEMDVRPTLLHGDNEGRCLYICA